MKKTLQTLAASILLSIPFSGIAQLNMWTWVNGSNAIDETGNYGTMGTAAPTNSPGSRVSAATWTDNSGNLWLFGGSGYSTGNMFQGAMQDLWKYTIATNQWTWVKGSSNLDMNGVYSGFVPSNNMPGGRAGATTWKDNNGNFYLFGGYGFGAFGGGGRLNDLWRYNPATNQWSWLKGASTVDQSATYGTLGTSAFANTPGARDGAIGWVGPNGDLWLYGGTGFDGGIMAGQLGDLWKYDIALNEWTWVSGPNSIDQPGTYGTQGLPGATNIPGCRAYPVAFNDGTNFWLFGGMGFASTSVQGNLNDLWKYDVVANEWIWMKGSNTVAQAGVYGTQGVFASANTPGARQLLVSWTTNNDFWILEGNDVPGGAHSDFWKYNTILNQWSWVGGVASNNQSGSFGSIGVAAASNFPSSREQMTSWTDNNSNLWLFGGYGMDASAFTGLLNDLWKFTPCVIPSSPSGSTPLANLSLCSNNTTTLSATSNGTVSWFNVPAGGSSLGSGVNFVTPVLTAAASPSTIVYYAEAATCATSITRTAVSVTVNPVPSVNVISSTSILCAGQSATLTASGASSYSWSNGGSTPNITVSPTSNTSYTVTGTNSYNCTNQSVYTQSVSPCTGIENLNGDLSEIIVFPNPFSDKLSVTGTEANSRVTVYNSLGALIYSVKTESEKTELDLSACARGIYFVRIESGNDILIKKIIKD